MPEIKVDVETELVTYGCRACQGRLCLITQALVVVDGLKSDAGYVPMACPAGVDNAVNYDRVKFEDVTH